MKAVVAAFNQEKALVGAFSVITNLRMTSFPSCTGYSGCVVQHDPEHDAADGMDINTAGTSSITYAGINY